MGGRKFFHRGAMGHGRECAAALCFCTFRRVSTALADFL